MDELFTCEACGVTFVKAVSGIDAEKEYQENYPHFGRKADCVVCDGCYRELMLGMCQ